MIFRCIETWNSWFRHLHCTKRSAVQVYGRESIALLNQRSIYRKEFAMLYDLPLEELKTYLPARTEPADFDAFWEKTLAAARQFPLEARFVPVETGLKLVETFDVTFNGFGGQPIKGWFILPKGEKGPLPCVAGPMQATLTS
jgi:hypothetical protein